VLGIWTELARSPGHAKLFHALGTVLDVDMTRPPARSLPDEAQILKLVAAAGFQEIETNCVSLRTTYASARRFVGILIAGSSKLTREALANIPADRRIAFINEVAEDLRAL